MSDHNEFLRCIALERQIRDLLPEALQQVHAWDTGNIELMRSIEPRPGSEIVMTSQALSAIAKKLGETLFANFNDTPMIVPPAASPGEILVDYNNYRTNLQTA